MKIKTSHEHIQNTTLTFPIDGELKIENGVVEVSDELGALLIENGSGWESAEETEQTGSKNDKSGNGKTKEPAKTTKETAKKKVIESDDVQDELTGMPLKDMIELAEKAGLKGWQIFKNREAHLRTFLRKKLNEQ